MIKSYYDKSHQAINLLVGLEVFLRLHYDYELSDITNKKLYQQRAGLFKILDKVGSLVYRLQLSPVM